MAIFLKKGVRALSATGLGKLATGYWLAGSIIAAHPPTYRPISGCFHPFVPLTSFHPPDPLLVAARHQTVSLSTSVFPSTPCRRTPILQTHPLGSSLT
jgi:hypothetical protein